MYSSSTQDKNLRIGENFQNKMFCFRLYENTQEVCSNLRKESAKLALVCWNLHETFFWRELHGHSLCPRHRDAMKQKHFCCTQVSQL